MHRYLFTVRALPVEKLELSVDTPPALVGFTLNNLAPDKAH
ncbi:hypothetical protein ACPV54_24900 [Vibrio mediterranei]|jgi:phosphatidylethanolamine-binding protein (PEBP) family uncharacterized protein|uniref:Phosphatidylethanolamine-binding protein n=1 Tax=Vibrio barjaei TaxID=1676683 RepID=A0ABW7IMZ0_9VIBR